MVCALFYSAEASLPYTGFPPSPSVPRRGSRAHAFAPLALPSSAGVTRLRLGRLRTYISARIQPSFRGLPLLEHATAVLDAQMLMRTFSEWVTQARAMRLLRTERRRALLQKYWDKLEILADKMKDVKRLAVVNVRRTGKAIFMRWLRSFRARKQCEAAAVIVQAFATTT